MTVITRSRYRHRHWHLPGWGYGCEFLVYKEVYHSQLSLLGEVNAFFVEGKNKLSREDNWQV